jgi:hypothetical protein
VLHRIVDVLMFVSLRHVQPNADQHKDARRAEGPIELALSDREGERSPGKWSSGKIGSGASRPEMAKRVDEKNKADTVTEKTNHRHAQDNA